MSRWDEIVEEVRIINTSRGIDMVEARKERIAKRIEYQEIAKKISVSISDIIDYEHERKPISEDKYEAYMICLNGG